MEEMQQVAWSGCCLAISESKASPVRRVDDALFIHHKIAMVDG
jgi:hypothetical protein